MQTDMNLAKVVSLRSFYASILILCNVKEMISFGTVSVSKKAVALSNEKSKLTLQLSFDDCFVRRDDEEETEEMRIQRLISERIAAENAKFQSRYNRNENENNFQSLPSTASSPSAEQFAAGRMLSREDRILELKRISAAKARSERIAAMKAALEEERRIEADKVQDELMAAERVRLEAQQRSRDIAEKRLAAEKDNKLDAECIGADVTNRKGADAHYQALITDGMSFATEKAEKFIAEEEARIAEATRRKGSSSSRRTPIISNKKHHRLASPKQLLSRISVEEARVKEEKQLVKEILEEAKIASQIAQEDADASELVRLAAVQAEAERLIQEKNQQLAIIAKEKRLATEMVHQRRTNY